MVQNQITFQTLNAWSLSIVNSQNFLKPYRAQHNEPKTVLHSKKNQKHEGRCVCTIGKVSDMVIYTQEKKSISIWYVLLKYSIHSPFLFYVSNVHELWYLWKYFSRSSIIWYFGTMEAEN